MVMLIYLVLNETNETILVRIGISGTQRSSLCTQKIKQSTSTQSALSSNRLDLVAQLVEHWTSIPKVAGSIPTVVRQTFQLARCGCTLRVTSQT